MACDGPQFSYWSSGYFATVDEFKAPVKARRTARSFQSFGWSIAGSAGEASGVWAFAQTVPSDNAKAPRFPGRSQFNQSAAQAATWVGLTSRSLLKLAIGIARGFIASGISRARSTCRSPFSRLAPLTLT